VYGGRNESRHPSAADVYGLVVADAQGWHGPPSFSCAHETHAGVCAFVSMLDRCVSWSGGRDRNSKSDAPIVNAVAVVYDCRTRRATRIFGGRRPSLQKKSSRSRRPQPKPWVATAPFFDDKTTMSHVVIEPATAEDLDELSDLLGELFSEESDFRPNKEKQLRGLRLIFEQPNRGRVFVLRRDHSIVGMINLLFTISTAEGGFVMLLEDLVIHKGFRDHGYGSQLLEYAIDFARKKNFLRITLLTDRPEIKSQAFFKRHGFFESAMIPMRLLITPETPQSDVTL
jgi:GNAT superfamily N-acetyltransferase